MHLPVLPAVLAVSKAILPHSTWETPCDPLLLPAGSSLLCPVCGYLAGWNLPEQTSIPPDSNKTGRAIRQQDPDVQPPFLRPLGWPTPMATYRGWGEGRVTAPPMPGLICCPQFSPTLREPTLCSLSLRRHLLGPGERTMREGQAGQGDKASQSQGESQPHFY